MNKRAFAKVARHGSSAMIAIPRPLLFHLDCLYGDYVVLSANDDGSITMRKGEIHEHIGTPKTTMMRDEAPAVKP